MTKLHPHDISIFQMRAVIDAVFEVAQEYPLDEDAAHLKFQCTENTLDTIQMLLRDDEPVNQAERLIRARVQRKFKATRSVSL